MGNNHIPSFPSAIRVFLLISLAAVVLAAFLTACAPLNASQDNRSQTSQSEETPDTEQDQTEPTLQTGLSANPTATLTPASIPIDSTQGVNETPSADGGKESPAFQAEIEFGTADLAILRPGQLSRHTTPIRIIANLNSIIPLETEITLYGEDGRILASKTLWSKPYDDPINGNLITDIEFSIPVLAETGRLELKASDASGREWALNSVYLILLSRGITDRNYAPESQDRILLQLPFPDQREIDSSPIFISGLVRTSSDHPLTISLIDESGNQIGEGLASVVLTPGNPYGQFVGEIPFQVSGPTRVWMTFKMQEGRIPGFTYLKTIEFTLIPSGN